MILSDKQLKIQEWADKNIKHGCIVKLGDRVLTVIDLKVCEHRQCSDNDCIEYSCTDFAKDSFYDMYYISHCDIFSEENIILGHPMTYGRLGYLYENSPNPQPEELVWNRVAVMNYFHKHYKFYDKTVLERPEELQDLVIEFLLSLPKEGGS